jgi:hypothetical protein
MCYGTPSARGCQSGAVVALIAPVLAVAGVIQLTDGLSRIQREEPVLLAIALTLAVLSGALLSIAICLCGAEPNEDRMRSARKLSRGALFIAVFGFGLAVALGTWGANQGTRPLISASFDERTATLTAEVSTSGLADDRRLAVKVDLQTVEPARGLDDPRPFSFRGSLPLSRAYVGPDAGGDVSQKLGVPILTGGPYTHIVIEATPNENEAPCTEFPTQGSPDDETACVFIPLFGE